MMQIALARLRAIWPDASIQVLTDDPNRLADYCPHIHPMAAGGRHAWTQSGLLRPEVYDGLPDELKVVFRILRRTLKRSNPAVAKRLAISKLRSFCVTDLDTLDHYLEAVRHADLVIVTGMGGITDAFPEYAFGLLETLDLAMESGAMTAIVGQGLGPLERPDLIAIAKRVLPKIDFISLREGLYGLPLLQRLGVARDRVAVTGDDAIELAYQRHPPVIGNHLGVNVRRASYSSLDPLDIERVRAPVVSIIELLKCSAISVPVSQRAEESDSKSFSDLLGSQVDESQCGQNITTPIQLIDQIGRCRLVIVGSYHAALFALAQGVSAIGLAGNAYYIQKFEGLADQFGSGCEVIRFHENGFQEALRSAATRMWNMADDVRPQLLSRAAQQVMASKAAYEALSEKANSRFAVASDRGMIPSTRFHRFVRTTATLRRKLLRKADHTRWTDAENFCPEWSERAKIIAGLIPKGSRVIEFGAGMRQLQSYLDPSCTYIASDLISRGQDELIVDLEKRPLPELPDDKFDVAVFAGVLEYLSDAPSVLSWICQYVTACIFSYECAPRANHIYERLKQTWNRAALGWVNAYTEDELKSIVTRAGFFCATQTIWNAQDGSEAIFVFQRVSSYPATPRK